ncbi:hypothetical protein D3C78_1080580 [compost metagenome]
MCAFSSRVFLVPRSGPALPMRQPSRTLLNSCFFCASVALPRIRLRMPNWFCGICPSAGSAAEMIAKTSARVTNETCGPPYSRGMEMLPRPLRVNSSISDHGSLRNWSRLAACRRATCASSWAALMAWASLRKICAGNNNGAMSRSLWTIASARLDISAAPWLHAMPWRSALG